MATSAVSILAAGHLSKAAFSLVNNNSGEDAATGLKVTRVSIRHSSRAMRHTREDGTTVVDIRVIDPVSVTAEVIAPSSDQLSALNNALMDKDNTFTMTSKSLMVGDLVFQDINVRQSPDMISATPAKLLFKQLLRQGGAASAETHQVVEQSADSSMFNRGIQSLKQAEEQFTTAVSKIVSQMTTPSVQLF